MLYSLYIGGKILGESFSTYIVEVRSIIPESVHVMALTATATLSTQKYIIKALSMQAPAIIYVPPVRENIVINKFLHPIVEKLKRDRTLGRTIIFCRTYANVIAIFHGHIRRILYRAKGLT